MNLFFNKGEAIPKYSSRTEKLMIPSYLDRRTGCVPTGPLVVSPSQGDFWTGNSVQSGKSYWEVKSSSERKPLSFFHVMFHESVEM